jgi:hypothetical protein
VESHPTDEKHPQATAGVQIDSEKLRKNGFLSSQPQSHARIPNKTAEHLTVWPFVRLKERGGELRQVGSEQLRLIGGLVLASVSKQDYRWRSLLPGREERSEISVRRDDDSALSVGVVEDLLV